MWRRVSKAVTGVEQQGLPSIDIKPPSPILSNKQNVSRSRNRDDQNKSNGKLGNDTSQKIYNLACKKFKIQPIKRIHADLCLSELVLQDQSLGVLGAKTLAIALVKNATCSKVHLEGNDIGANGAICIAQMLRENVTIVDLSLSDNNIGSIGAEYLVSVLKENRFLHSLKLKGNNLGEEDAKIIAGLIMVNTSLESLDLSYNCFREKGGLHLKPAIAKTRVLHSLNLSWNHLRLSGAVAIAQGLQENNSLKSLDVSWNGFGMEGCAALSLALEHNTCIRELDLSANRISVEPLKALLPGLVQNKSLSSLVLASNPLSSDAAMKLLQAISSSTSSRLIYIDINTVSIDGKFEEEYENIRSNRGLIIKHGIVLRRDELTETDTSDVINEEDPLFVLFEFMKQQNLRLRDLYAALDRNAEGRVKRRSINEVLLSSNIVLSKTNLDRLMKKIDIDRKGYVEFQDLSAANREYVRTMTLRKRRRASSLKAGLSVERDNVETLRNKIKGLMDERRRSSIIDLNRSASSSRRSSIKDSLLNKGRRSSIIETLSASGQAINDEMVMQAGVVNNLFSRRRGSLPVLPGLGGQSPTSNELINPFSMMTVRRSLDTSTSLPFDEIDEITEES
ncbi:uncharacterized protein LOC141905338 [Tubulanus polymorphus]|uniref:uncharacterized protein LOC141905338 n=1 Tax=Tubulanus polymorphus TaxID=672921 RepID=UPI003DA3E9B9